MVPLPDPDAAGDGCAHAKRIQNSPFTSLFVFSLSLSLSGWVWLTRAGSACDRRESACSRACVSVRAGLRCNEQFEIHARQLPRAGILATGRAQGGTASTLRCLSCEDGQGAALALERM
jgi:hypothetical protein